jgi:hypothetical protein
VTGATGSISNLTLGVTSATVAGPPVRTYLSVDNIGRVRLDSVNVIANTTVTMRAFGVAFTTNTNLSSGASAIYTFNSGLVLPTQASVAVSPVSSQSAGFTINWARVKNATEVEISVTNGGNTQVNFNPGQGMAFHVTVFGY